MTSSRLGISPEVTTRSTTWPVCAVVAKVAASVIFGPGAGRSASVASVMTPRVPSEPTNNRVRS